MSFNQSSPIALLSRSALQRVVAAPKNVSAFSYLAPLSSPLHIAFVDTRGSSKRKGLQSCQPTRPETPPPLEEFSFGLAAMIRASCRRAGRISSPGPGHRSSHTSTRSAGVPSQRTMHGEGRTSSGDAVIQGTVTEFCGGRGCVLFTPMHDEKIGSNFC